MKKVTQKNLKKERGITLVALVVTIVVLLILAGISINAVLGNNGLITRARNAKIEQAHAQVKDAIILAYGEYQIDVQTSKNVNTKNEIKIASVEAVVTSASELTFLEFLQGKGYVDENGIVNVENLVGSKLDTGNGTDGTDVYKVEESGDYYQLNYYGKNSESVINLTQFGKIGGTTSSGSDEVLTAPETYAYSFNAGYKDGVVTSDIIAYVVENEEDNTKYDMIFIGTGDMAPAYEWDTEIIETYDDEYSVGGVFVEYKIEISTVKIVQEVTSIGSYAFFGCNNITSIIIPNNVTTIGGAAFSGCSGLTSITIPGSVISINNFAFYNCSNLGSIVIPNSVISIGYSSFYNCSNLAIVNYSGTEEKWNAIEIDYNNDYLTNATIVYNYIQE